MDRRSNSDYPCFLPPPGKTLLNTLPLELQQEILRYLLLCHRTIDIKSCPNTKNLSSTSLSILRVSKSFNLLALQILYSENRFLFSYMGPSPIDKYRSDCWLHPEEGHTDGTQGPGVLLQRAALKDHLAHLEVEFLLYKVKPSRPLYVEGTMDVLENMQGLRSVKIKLWHGFFHTPELGPEGFGGDLLRRVELQLGHVKEVTVIYLQSLEYNSVRDHDSGSWLATKLQERNSAWAQANALKNG